MPKSTKTKAPVAKVTKARAANRRTTRRAGGRRAALKPRGNHDVAALMQKFERQEVIVRELADRQAILDCAIRFSRGVNRRDREVLLSVFHEDAIDDHGFFVGNREDFTKWIDTVYNTIDVTQHFVTNQTVELDGDTAHAEIYWFVANVAKGSVSVTLRGGRYIDRLERRRGVWAIVDRVCLIEWNCTTGDFQMPPDVLAILAKSGVPTTNKNDPSYIRPLRIKRKPHLAHPHSQNAAPGRDPAKPKAGGA